ncbi:hypothetical protein Bca101_081282 [Brassica carinata]
MCVLWTYGSADRERQGFAISSYSSVSVSLLFSWTVEERAFGWRSEAGRNVEILSRATMQVSSKLIVFRTFVSNHIDSRQKAMTPLSSK